MTVKNKQMYDDFQLVYNNLASQLAPGLDTFEISMYLTKAYFTLVTQSAEQYEKSERARKSLTELVDDAKLSEYIFSNAADYKITEESVFFKLPSNVLYIVYESIIMSTSHVVPECIRGKKLDVVPVNHDDFTQVYRNPFKFTQKKALRLDITNDNGERLSEIVTKDSHISKYHIRYIRKPSPIILETLTGNDYIEGQQQESECELNSILYQDIVRLAAQMAYKDYKSA